MKKVINFFRHLLGRRYVNVHLVKQMERQGFIPVFYNHRQRRKLVLKGCPSSLVVEPSFHIFFPASNTN